MKEKKFYTTGQVAKICGVSSSTVKRWVDRHEIKGFRLPGSRDWRVTKHELIDFMKENGFPLDDLTTSGRKKIIVVDDDKRFLNFAKKVLTDEARFDLKFFQNGYEACIKFGNFEPDLVILDVMMPDIDGLEVARIIKESQEHKNTAILFVSGYLDEELREKMKEYSSHILAKPVSHERFKATVLKILG